MHDSTKRQVSDKGQPKGMVAHYPSASEVYTKEGYRSYEHGTEHQARSRGTDEYAIVKEGGKACQRDGKYPIEIGGRGGYDTLLIGDKAEELFAADAVYKGSGQCQCNAPDEELADHLS